MDARADRDTKAVTFAGCEHPAAVVVEEGDEEDLIAVLSRLWMVDEDEADEEPEGDSIPAEPGGGQLFTSRRMKLLWMTCGGGQESCSRISW
jgi:hypothetical protein